MKNIKILQINVWGGRIKDGLTRFIIDGDYDVICMQEAIWENEESGFLDLFVDSVEKIKESAGFQYDFKSAHYGIEVLSNEILIEHGNAILSKIPLIEAKEEDIFGEYGALSNISTFKAKINEHKYTAQKVVLGNGLVVLNYHGYWLPNSIGDETTIECMKKVANMIRDESRPVVVCGDLNVSAESPAMRELDFLTDLTKINDVKTTLRNIRFKKDVACDHILVNDKVSYTNFEVINAPISDHRVLSIEIKI